MYLFMLRHKLASRNQTGQGTDGLPAPQVTLDGIASWAHKGKSFSCHYLELQCHPHLGGGELSDLLQKSIL